MRTLFLGIAGLVMLLFASVSAQAGEKPLPAGCGTDECPAYKAHNWAPVGHPTSCLVDISAPTYGGLVTLDVRDKNRESIWRNANGQPAPRAKLVGPGTVHFRIGCQYLEEPTEEVYMCADGTKGGDGKSYSSIRFRRYGYLDKVLATRQLKMCLLGDKCDLGRG